MKKANRLINYVITAAVLLTTSAANAAPTAIGTPTAIPVDSFKLHMKVNATYNYTVNYDSSNSKLTRAVLGNNLIDIKIDPFQVPGAAGIAGWNLILKGPGTSSLIQASYAPAVDATLTSTSPGLSLINDATDCFPVASGSVGSFEIKRISRTTRKLKVDFNINSCTGSHEGYFILNLPADVTTTAYPQTITGSSRFSQYYDASNLIYGGQWRAASGQSSASLDVKLPSTIRLKNIVANYPSLRSKITYVEGYIDNTIVAAGSPPSCASCPALSSESFFMTERVNRIKIYFSRASTNTQYVAVSSLSIFGQTDFANWQNQENRLDVNSDGYVSPIDALLIINQVNQQPSRLLGTYHPYTLPLWDVTGDNLVTSADALAVINYLNSR